MNANEIFENHGLSFNDSEHAAAELADLNLDELWDITDDFIVDELEVTGNEDEQAATLRTALVHAFENDLEAITQQDFDLAREQAIQIGDADEDEPEQSASEDETEQSATEDAEDASGEDETEDEPDQAASATPKPRKKRKRTSAGLAAVRRLVEADNTAEAATVVEQAQQEVDIAESTLTAYYYKVRREMGLAGTGKRGRKPNDTKDQVRAIIENNWDAERADII